MVQPTSQTNIILLRILLLLPIDYHLTLAESDLISPGCGRLAVKSHRMKNKLPWEAKLERRNEIILDATWTAVIITETLILAAINSIWEYCDLLSISPFEKYTVYTNLTQFSSDKDDPSVGRSKITHLRPHPNYRHSHTQYSTNNNYILVHLKAPLTFDDQIHNICLPGEKGLKRVYQSPHGDMGSMFMSGWNRYYTKKFSKLIVNDDDYCNSTWVNETKHAKIYENYICANITEQEEGCILLKKGAVALNDIYHNGTYFLMSILVTKQYDCGHMNTVFMPLLDTPTMKWISNNIRCGPNNYTCDNGECVSLESICNNKTDCTDNSDENSTLCYRPFICKFNGRKVAISEDKLCDSVKDCDDGEDEKNCPITTVASNIIVFSTFCRKVVVVLSVIFVVVFIVISVKIHQTEKIANETPDLADGEVKEFYNGRTNNLHLDNDGISLSEIRGHRNYGSSIDDDRVRENPEDPEYLNNLVQHMKWETIFEIPKSSFFINKKKVLGGGEYGVVYGGIYMEKEDGDYSICKDVAVKVVRLCNDIEHFKALLAELKVLVYLGPHENIVEFVGANTEDIKQRNLEVIMELCPRGSLESYLRGNSYSFLSLTNNEAIAISSDLSRKPFIAWLNKCCKGFNIVMHYRKENPDETKILTTSDLLRWCQQVANAMDYLSSKQVIHGDLAIRNVLLSFDFVAKVGDFGLSTKLYEYRTYYVKKNAVPLPIPWLAIETIRDLKFSYKSDVWSFGVTVWEIFSLGRVPYDELEWNVTNLYIQLCNGFRLLEPAHATPEMFNLMRSCWNSEPSERPTFADLKKSLASFESNLSGKCTLDPSFPYVQLDK